MMHLKFLHFPILCCALPDGQDEKAPQQPQPAKNPDTMETLTYSPVSAMMSLTPSSVSTPAPGILKTSSMVTQLQEDEENDDQEQAEEEQSTMDPCVCPGHLDQIIEIESGDECAMSPAKAMDTEIKEDKNALLEEGRTTLKKYKTMTSGELRMDSQPVESLEPPVESPKNEPPADTQVMEPPGDGELVEELEKHMDEMESEEEKDTKERKVGTFQAGVGW